MSELDQLTVTVTTDDPAAADKLARALGTLLSSAEFDGHATWHVRMTGPGGSAETWTVTPDD